MRSYLTAGRLIPITTSMYAALSQAIELLFVFAATFGNYSSAAIVHLSFLFALALGLVAFGRRFQRPVAGVVAAILVFASPVMGRTATVAYVDVAVASIIFGMFYLLEIWIVEKDTRLLVPVGLLAGFAFGAKLTAFLALPYALVVVAAYSWRSRRVMIKSMAVVAATSLVVCVKQNAYYRAPCGRG